MEKMQAFFSYIAKNFVSVLGMTILTGATVTTSALGIAKASKSMTTTRLQVPEVKGVNTAVSSSSSSVAKSASNTAGAANTNNSSSSRQALLSQQSSSTSTSSLSSSSQPASDGGCIITLFGKQYDVTTLQNTHSGGNVFVCGTDQSASYQSRHGTNMSRMQQYLVSSGGTAVSSANNTPAAAGTSVRSSSSVKSSSQSSGRSSSQYSRNRDDDDERDEDQEEEREHERERNDYESMRRVMYRNNFA